MSLKIKVLDQKGKDAGIEIGLDKGVFGAIVNQALIHEVAVAQKNNQRQGSKSTLARSEVRGHSAKPYRQKGTGRARQGSTKSIHHVGGGVAFAPKPRDFTTKINKRKKTEAFKSAISGKFADKELVVIKDLKLKEAKTKHVAKMLDGLKIEKSVVFVTDGLNQDFVRSANNIPNVLVTTASQLSVLDIVTSRFLIASVDAIKEIEANYKEVSK